MNDELKAVAETQIGTHMLIDVYADYEDNTIIMDVSTTTDCVSTLYSLTKTQALKIASWLEFSVQDLQTMQERD